MTLIKDLLSQMYKRRAYFPIFPLIIHREILSSPHPYLLSFYQNLALPIAKLLTCIATISSLFKALKKKPSFFTKKRVQ